MLTTVFPPTPGQTIGPFFAFALPFDDGDQLVPRGATGAIRFHGRVTDGAGQPVPDALLEIWQADADGVVPRAGGSLRRDGWTFTGWGRASTDDEGHYSFTTVEPGATEPGAAAFFAVAIFGRGLLNRLFTRAYVPGDALTGDRLLASLPPERRDTLITERDDTGLRFDIRLQGERETVFLHHTGR